MVINQARQLKKKDMKDVGVSGKRLKHLQKMGKRLGKVLIDNDKDKV